MGFGKKWWLGNGIGNPPFHDPLIRFDLRLPEISVLSLYHTCFKILTVRSLSKSHLVVLTDLV